MIARTLNTRCNLVLILIIVVSILLAVWLYFEWMAWIGVTEMRRVELQGLHAERVRLEERIAELEAQLAGEEHLVTEE